MISKKCPCFLENVIVLWKIVHKFWKVIACHRTFVFWKKKYFRNSYTNLDMQSVSGSLCLMLSYEHIRGPGQLVGTHCMDHSIVCSNPSHRLIFWAMLIRVDRHLHGPAQSGTLLCETATTWHRERPIGGPSIDRWFTQHTRSLVFFSLPQNCYIMSWFLLGKNQPVFYSTYSGS